MRLMTSRFTMKSHQGKFQFVFFTPEMLITMQIDSQYSLIYRSDDTPKLNDELHNASGLRYVYMCSLH